MSVVEESVKQFRPFTTIPSLHFFLLCLADLASNFQSKAVKDSSLVRLGPARDWRRWMW